MKEKSLSQVECHTYNQNTQAKLHMVYDIFMQYLPKQHDCEENPKVMILKVPQTSVPSQHPGIFYRKQLNHVIKQVKILSNKNAATNHDLIG